MDLGLMDRIVIVTGGSKGIGRAIAEEMASEGARLVICSRGKDILAKVAENIRRNTRRDVFEVFADLSNIDGVKSLISQTMRHFGRIDILVNNAGSVRAGSILNKPDEDWAEDWSLKVFGYLRMAREVIPIMKSQGGGRIINIIGTAGQQPTAEYIAGGGGNAALMNMTKALAFECASYNILVNAVSPGPIRTERWNTIVQTVASEQGRSPEEMEERLVRSYPLKRPGEPREVAAVVAFLASERSSYINGTTIPVDGGDLRGV
jgi:NAD(P)-dependent dehydrogenase (short-subunit alcohol dehydrogenase family)